MRKLTIITSLANNNASKTAEHQTHVISSVYDMVEGECLYTEEHTVDTENVALAGYVGILDAFDWIGEVSNIRGQVDIEFITTNANLNSSLMKLSRTYNLIEHSWNATKMSIARKGHSGAAFKLACVEYIEKLLTANYKADPQLVRLQAKLIYHAVGTLKPRTGEFKMWAMSLKTLRASGNVLLQNIVKSQQAVVIRLSGLGDDIAGKKFNNETKIRLVKQAVT